MNSKTDRNSYRLNHYLASCGVGSRRACEKYVREGRIMVNGQKITDPSMRVGDEVITFDRKRVGMEKEKYYLILHKPPAYLCSAEDPSGRPLALDLVSPHISARLYTVGRLDFMSSGIIIITNDGNFSDKVSHPSSGIEKEYLVETKKPIPKDFLEKCRHGIVLGGVRYKIKRYTLQTSRKARLVLEEGKNREIRKLFTAGKLTIKRLHRIRIGPVRLGGLKSGEFRRLKPAEIKSLMKKSGR